MKRLALLFLLVGTIGAATAQNSKVQSAYSYMVEYQRTEMKNKDALLKAKTAIDVATKHEVTQNSGKAWLYRGKIYMSLMNDEELKAQAPEASAEALASFKQACTLEDKKFKNKSEAYQNILALSAGFFNEGVQGFNDKNYKGAYEAFMKAKEANEFLESKEQKTAVKTEDCVSNAAMAASNAGMTAEATAIYEGLIENGTAQANEYRILADYYKKGGDKAKAQETIQAAMNKWPENVDLIIDDLNFYLEAGKPEEAIGKLQKAIELDPGNDQLMYVLGTAYENSGDVDNAKIQYKKAIETNPMNFNANYAMGASFFNSAGLINDEMNGLGFSTADQKKYDALKVDRNKQFEMAKPYFDKAAEINPDDEGVKKALKKIASFLAG